MREIEVTNMSWGMRIGVVLGMALAIGLAAAFVVLTLGIAILLLPVIAVVLAIGWWRWRKIEARLREERARDNAFRTTYRVIETDYKAIGRESSGRR
ncbi:MAG TPA: hypothetical protein VFK86_17675 [Bauldia sp.]|nr:hypothetical protein [Bauldia sp.]